MQKENDKKNNHAESVEMDAREQEIDETLDESFPASDPPSWTLGTNHRDKSFDKNDPQNRVNERAYYGFPNREPYDVALPNVVLRKAASKRATIFEISPF